HAPRQWDGGAIVPASEIATKHRNKIIPFTNHYKLPTVYAYRYFVTGGGLISYGPDTNEPYRLAAGYVDRILRGEKPGDLPVQTPTKLELVINLKTAKAPRRVIPAPVLARATGGS